MKLLSFRRPDGTESWGILKAEGVIDLGSRTPGLKHALWATTSLADKTAAADDHDDFATDPLGALRKAASAKAGKDDGKAALLAGLGAGKQAPGTATAATPRVVPAETPAARSQPFGPAPKLIASR